MKKITVCKECGQDYMYDPNWEPQYKDMCQDCYEKSKLKILPEEEYEKALQEEDSLLVCMNGDSQYFPDNIESTCHDCGCKIYYRHYNEKATTKVCVNCAIKRMEKEGAKK